MDAEPETEHPTPAAPPRSLLLRHERLVKLGLAAGSLLLTLAALEGLARATRYRGPGKEAGTVDLYTEFDPLLGWRKRPGAHATRRHRDYTVELSINSLGLRDKERRYAAAPGTFRILALGDSFVEAYTVPLEDTVTQVLERSLSSSGTPTEVINGGTAGYSTDQEYLFYVTEGRRYAPNVVLLFFYFNDVFFNGSPDYFGSPMPLFSVVRDELIAPRPLVPPPPRPARASPPAPAANREPEGWATLRWLDDRLTTRASRLHERLAALGLWEPMRRQIPHMQLRVYKRKRIAELEADWDLTSRLLRQLSHDVAASGARFAVVYVPSTMEVSDRAWELSQVHYGMDDAGWDRGRVLMRLRDIAATGSFPVLDLTPALRAADHGILGGPYLLHDGHWNASGHRIAAAEVRRFLGAEGWLPTQTARASLPAAR